MIFVEVDYYIGYRLIMVGGSEYLIFKGLCVFVVLVIKGMLRLVNIVFYKIFFCVYGQGKVLVNWVYMVSVVLDIDDCKCCFVLR